MQIERKLREIGKSHGCMTISIGIEKESRVRRGGATHSLRWVITHLNFSNVFIFIHKFRKKNMLNIILDSFCPPYFNEKILHFAHLNLHYHQFVVMCNAKYNDKIYFSTLAL